MYFSAAASSEKDHDSMNLASKTDRILYQRADPARDRAAAAGPTRLHFQSLIAAKVAHCMLTAPGKLPVDFGMRRARRRVSTACGALPISLTALGCP
jgi:hypothetical protein